MLTMRKIILIALCGTFVASLAAAQLTQKTGTAGFQFLRIGVGARETALGESGTAFAEGAGAIFWNPAGLTNGDRTEVQFFYNPWFASIKQSFMAAKIPITADNVVGLSVNLLSMDDMEETTIDEPQGTGRKFTSGDMALGATYAQRISDRFTAAVTAKYVREYIWDMVADGWAFDIGMQYRFDNLYLGMVMKDFGPNKEISGGQLEMNQQIFENWDTSPALVSVVPKDIRLPVSFQFGAGYAVLENESHRVRAMGNIAYYMDIGEVENLGAEYTFLGDYSLRVGYKFKRDIMGLAFGAGVKTMLGSMEVGADFAAVQMSDFGYRTQFSLSMSF
jgi:hypothetical protein